MPGRGISGQGSGLRGFRWSKGRHRGVLVVRVTSIECFLCLKDQGPIPYKYSQNFQSHRL